MMLTSKGFHDSLVPYFEAELDAVQEKRMDTHRKACPECEAAYRAVMGKRLEERRLLGIDARRPFRDYLWDETLQEYVAGQLTGEEAEYVRKHTAECPSCGSQLQEFVQC